MEDYKLGELKNRLDAIDRLCIVYASREELVKELNCTIGKNKHLGSLGNNDIHRKKSIYETLCSNVKGNGIIDVDLDRFLTCYKKTSEFYNNMKLRLLFRSNEGDNIIYKMCFNLLDSQFKSDSDLLSISSKRLFNVIREFKSKGEKENYDSNIIVLLALDLLPSYGRDNGFSLNIPDAVKKLFDFIDKYFIHNNISPKDPNYQIVKINALKELKSLPRLYLYIILSLAVKDVEVMHDPKKRYEREKDYEKRKIMPLNEDMPSYWYDTNEDENNPLYVWKFLPFKINRSYILLRYENRNSREKVRAKVFEIQFFGSNKIEGAAIVYNQLSFKNILCNEIPDNRSSQILNFYIKSNNVQKELKLSINEGYNWFNNHHFRKANDEIVNSLNNRLRKYGEIIENEIGFDVTYFSLQALKAITRNGLYIEAEGRSELYYLIDRRRYDGLELVNIDDIITLTIIGGEKPKKVIYVNSIGLTIDISNEAKMKENSVLLVDSIKP